MSITRPTERYDGHNFFVFHTAISFVEAEENLWLLEHDHAFAEIVLVVEGEGLHYLNGTPLRVGEGDLFVLPIGTRHVFRPSGPGAGRGGLKVWNCLFRPAAIRGLASLLADSDAERFLSWLIGEGPSDRAWLRLSDGDGRFRSRMAELRGAYARQRVEPDALTLWSAALSLLAALSAADTPSRPPLAEHRALANAIADMRRRYAEKLTLSGVAARAGIGARQLSRLFAERTGRTFLSHLADVRVEACCRLLRETDVPIMDLPPLVGYAQWKTLSRAFRERTGVTLRAYRDGADNAPPSPRSP